MSVKEQDNKYAIDVAEVTKVAIDYMRNPLTV